MRKSILICSFEKNDENSNADCDTSADRFVGKIFNLHLIFEENLKKYRQHLWLQLSFTFGILPSCISSAGFTSAYDWNQKDLMCHQEIEDLVIS